VAYVIFALAMGLATGVVGRLKGSSFLLWLLIGAVLPVLGLAGALLYRYERDEPRRECPRCGRILKIYDQVCTSCGYDLPFPEAALPPESATAKGSRAA
jgi:hypothetical protein